MSLLKNNQYLKIKYNITVFITSVLGFANTIFNLNIFGVSMEVDAFFVSMTIYTTFSYVPLLFIEQFFIYYNDLKYKSRIEAEKLFSSVFYISEIFQIFLTAILFLGFDFFLRLFVSGFDVIRFSITKNLFIFFCLSLLFVPTKIILSSVFLSERHFFIGFVQQMVTPVLTAVSYLYMYIAHVKNIYLLAVVFLIGEIIVFIMQLLYMRRVGIQFRISFIHPQLFPFIRKSFLMNASFRIKEYLAPFIITNILSTLPVGQPAVYSYSNKFVMMLQSVIVGPSSKMVATDISLHWAAGEKLKCIRPLKIFITTITGLLIMGIGLTYFITPFLLQIIAKNKLSMDTVHLIQVVFIIFSVWLMLDSIDSAFAQFFIISKKSWFFMLKNSIFIIFLFFFSMIFTKIFFVKSIPIAMSIAEAAALILNITLWKKIFSKDQLSLNGVA